MERKDKDGKSQLEKVNGKIQKNETESVFDATNMVLLSTISPH